MPNKDFIYDGLTEKTLVIQIHNRVMRVSIFINKLTYLKKIPIALLEP